MPDNKSIDYAKPTTVGTTTRKRNVWPFIIVGLLAAHVGGMLLIVSIAQRSKPAVIEDYYQKAINWDRDHGRTGN